MAAIFFGGGGGSSCNIEKVQGIKWVLIQTLWLNMLRIMGLVLVGMLFVDCSNSSVPYVVLDLKPSCARLDVELHACMKLMLLTVHKVCYLVHLGLLNRLLLFKQLPSRQTVAPQSTLLLPLE